MDKVTLKEIREHCDRQCVRYGMNKDSDYYKEHYLIRELLDEINCDLEEYNKKIRSDAIEEYKGKMLSRLIPHLNDIECAKNSETYLAITEIAEQLKENNNG